MIYPPEPKICLLYIVFSDFTVIRILVLQFGMLLFSYLSVTASLIGVTIVVYWMLAKRAVKKAKVMHSYKAEQPDELSLEVGQIVEVLKQVHYALLQGRSNCSLACALDSPISAAAPLSECHQ